MGNIDTFVRKKKYFVWRLYCARFKVSGRDYMVYCYIYIDTGSQLTKGNCFRISEMGYETENVIRNELLNLLRICISREIKELGMSHAAEVSLF